MPFDVGWEEMVVVLIVVMMIFGPGRLPEFARTLGRFIREVRKMTSEVTGPLNELLNESLEPPVPPTIAQEPSGPPPNICPSCGAHNISEKTECGLCGTPLNPPVRSANALVEVSEAAETVPAGAELAIALAMSAETRPSDDRAEEPASPSQDAVEEPPSI